MPPPPHQLGHLTCRVRALLRAQTIISGTSPPTLAAAVASPSRLLEAKFHFNGKMESPTIYDVAFDASTKVRLLARDGLRAAESWVETHADIRVLEVVAGGSLEPAIHN